MNFLKKLGTVVLKMVGIATGLMPLIQQELPAQAAAVAGTVVDKLNQGLGVIVTTEQMFTAVSQASGQGSAKLQAATPFIAGLIQQTDMLTGKKPKDEAAFEAATTKLTSALADILNSYGD
jgi:hypothetical protein